MIAMKKLWIGLIFMLGLWVNQNGSAAPYSPDTKALVVILMGPPGAGKGTHAGPLSKHLGVPHISTGDLFRENIRLQTTLGKTAQTYINQGNLVPDELVLDMLFERVSLPDCKTGYILDGFPRTIAQAIALDIRLEGKAQVLALNFNLSDEQIIERITGRLACTGCGRPYHKTFDAPKQAMTCDQCGSALIQREDDKEEVIRKRLEVYRTQTAPLIDYYAQQPDVLKEIDSERDKAAVFNSVLDALSGSCLQVK